MVRTEFEPRGGNGSNGLSSYDRTLFFHAAYRGEVLDKDRLQEAVWKPTVARVVIPAVKAYESTLRNKGKGLPSSESRRAARTVQQHYEGEVLGVASVPSKERHTILEEVGKFVNMFLPRDAVLNALRALKTDFKQNGVPTTVRHEIFPPIARTSK